MKKIVLLSIISLFISGVVTDESVSVMEGDSVTLHTNTDTQRDDTIEWRFGDDNYLIARVNGGANSLRIYDDVHGGRFRDRLQVNNQTGDLIITNITTQHTGLYHLDVINKGTTRKTFIFSVYGDTVKVKTVMMGDSVILVNNVTKKPGDEKMVLRIQHNNSPVAEMIRNGKEANNQVYNGRFRDRLQVDDQTGDLVITNITPDDSGSYEVDITVGRHIYTINRLFSVNVKEQDQSSGSRSFTTAVIVVVLVLAVALVVVLYKCRSRTTGNEDRDNERDPMNEECVVLGAADGGGDEERLVKVYEGESADLKTEVTDIQRVDLIEWRFRETLIAEINPANNIFSTYDGDDDLFRDKLKLNHHTGDLNINDIRQKHTGVYKLKIIRDGETSDRRFRVSVPERQRLSP